MQARIENTRVTFGLYEVDLEAGELWKAGFRIKLQSQPFKVLTALLERPGQVVTREELQLRLWGRDTVVDFDHSLGTAINKIREALGDSADNPRFIETLSRRGYRFIAPVGQTHTPEIHEATDPAPRAETDLTETSRVETTRAGMGRAGTTLAVSESELTAIPFSNAPVLLGEHPALRATGAPAAESGRRIPGGWLAGSVAALVLTALIAYGFGASRAVVQPERMTQITHNGHLAPSNSTMETLTTGVTDGVHLFAPTIDSGRTGLAIVALSDGAVAPLEIPAEVTSPALSDISPDGSRLLLRAHDSPESEQPLWVVPTIGGSAIRIGNTLAHDATWMPDGNGILFAAGNTLYLTDVTGARPETYATLPGRAFWLRWQPNGHLLRFTMLDPLSHTPSLWQLSPGDRKAQRILAGFTNPSSECCGVWTADGRDFVFQSTAAYRSDLWKLRGDSTKDPVRLTDGPLPFESPVAARTGHRIFFLGVDARSELTRLTSAGRLVPERGFLAAAARLDYSRDGRWVAWTDDGGHLWRARADGSELLQLTPSNLVVFLATWSPDGKSLAAMAREPGKAWQIYLVSAIGGDLQKPLEEARNAADPSWSPDGQSLVFGRVNDAMGKESGDRTLHVLNLRTHQVEEVAGSKDLFSPRWSPDGRYIAALSLDQRQVRLLNTATHLWTTLPVTSGADPVWASDSKALYLHASLDPAQPILRISIPDGRVKELVSLSDSRTEDAVDFVFSGLGADNLPLIRTRNFTGNFYSLDIP